MGSLTLLMCRFYWRILSRECGSKCQSTYHWKHFASGSGGTVFETGGIISKVRHIWGWRHSFKTGGTISKVVYIWSWRHLSGAGGINNIGHIYIWGWRHQSGAGGNSKVGNNWSWRHLYGAGGILKKEWQRFEYLRAGAMRRRVW